MAGRRSKTREIRTVTLAATEVHAAKAGLGFINNIAVSGANVYAVGGGMFSTSGAALLVSSDGGATFAPWSCPPVALRDVHVDDAGVVVVGGLGTVARTADSGATWTTIATDQTGVLFVIERDLGGRWWIGGDSGLVMRSVSGTHFKRVPTKTTGHVLRIIFEPDSTWMLCGSGVLQRSPRGKPSFEEVPIAAMKVKRALTDLRRLPSGTLILIGDDGLILRSANDGKAWKKIPIDEPADLEDILVSPFGILIVGAKGTLLVSHDDGRTFGRVDSPMTNHLWAFAVVEDGIVIGGDTGQIYRITTRELGKLALAAYEGDDTVLADLSQHVIDGEPGAQMVFEDALRERGRW